VAENQPEGSRFMGEHTLLLLFLGVSITFYFIPTFVALERDHHQLWPILALNLFLGWTVVGWIAALIWSVTAMRRDGPGRGIAAVNDVAVN
jgi:hypothetical protein